jgi:hypothetical protein
VSNSYTEDHLVEQPAIQLMQHELGWDVGGNIEHRTSNFEHRSEEMKKTLAESKGETEKHFKLAWASPASLALAIHRFSK